MKVLLVHNYYGSSAPSGENVAFELERDLLVRDGHEVRTFVRHSDALRRQGWLGALRGGAATPFNPFARAALRRLADDFRPDVVHAHNTFPLISPAVFAPLGPRAARVLTLHNYRLFCPAAQVVRDGRPCTECLDRRSVLPALRHGCYRGSRVATLPLAANVALARAMGTWQRHVEAFVALTEFQRDLMVGAGLPGERVHVKPNFYPGDPVPVPWAQRRPAAVFAGRLSEEKGLSYLLEAWFAWGAEAPELRIAGDGPLRRTLEAAVRARGSDRVVFLGQLPAREAEAEIAGARLLLLPSIWYEGFPMVLREAFAFGTPAAVSDLGPLPALVEHGRAGLVFRPRDAAALLEVVRAGWADGPGLAERAVRARQLFDERYAEAQNLATLLAIYRSALAHRTGGERP